MQMRRLADLAFMFRLYELAYQIYHAAKKDFNNEHAWLHFAGAMVTWLFVVYLTFSVGSLHVVIFDYLCLFVCLCEQDNSKSYGRIILKF